jgi:hypothetical protein
MLVDGPHFDIVGMGVQPVAIAVMCLFYSGVEGTPELSLGDQDMNVLAA